MALTIKVPIAMVRNSLGMEATCSMGAGRRQFVGNWPIDWDLSSSLAISPSEQTTNATQFVLPSSGLEFSGPLTEVRHGNSGLVILLLIFLSK